MLQARTGLLLLLLVGLLPDPQTNAAAALAADPSELLRAVNVTWKSTDFKTILEWQSTLEDYVYTVEISSSKADRWKKKCIRTSATECDVTDDMKDVMENYSARILIEKQVTLEDDIEEPPHVNTPDFTPYLHTNIGQPIIESFSQNGTELRVVVHDPHTALRHEQNLKTLRGIFGRNLSYTLFYWKAASTGKKSEKTDTNEFLLNVEREDYCFNVQATIRSRSKNQKSPESRIACTSQKKVLSEELFFITGAAVFVIIVITIVILSVTLYRCRKRKDSAKKDHSALSFT
ncbi:tissue factor [Tachyglossus aculeatus]|uniref:tissue factor n=1 Tax=Tachyglossus aculeatus TaxID=9261 RepID=UPI0018F6E785|nr:tissue factor [Tachyglossus aculeatus]